MRRLLAWAALAAAGCAAPPPFRPPALPVPLPERWTAGDPVPGAPGAEWWTGFDDPALDGLLDEAVRQRSEPRLFAARLAQAAALARAAGAEILPRAALGAETARQKQVFIGIEIPGVGDPLSSRTRSYSVELDLAWEIDLWGRLRSGQSAALAEVQAGQADLAGALLSLRGRAAQAYFAAVEAGRQRDLARRTLESFALTASRIQERFDLGLRPAIDVALAGSSRSAAEAALRQREQELTDALRRLELAVGRYPAGAIEVAERLPALPGPVPAGLPAALLTRRPDLAAAERRLAAAGRRVDEARAAFYPRLSLTGSLGQTSVELGDLLRGDFTVWRLAGNLLQPLFEGGRLRAELDAARARSEEALALYAQTLLDALGEVETSLAAERDLASVEAALRRALEDARSALELSERLYLAGLEDLLTFQEAQRRVYELESRAIATSRRRLDNRVRLHLALGGGFRWPPP